MTEELKACPFCGCDLNSRSNVFQQFKSMHCEAQYIQCPRCGVRTRAEYDEYTLVQIWNERVE